jgi:methionine sulfoxide reductase heme-binding subunit
MYPWLDYRGRLSALKLFVFILLFIPGAWVALAYDLDHLGAQPILEAERQIGLWTIRLLFVALAITPLRDILHWPSLIQIRRMIGVGVFVYAVLHFLLYFVDQGFNLPFIASEIVLRIYLTIGFTAVVGAVVLAATSTDSTMRRLGGRRWQRLHQLIYVVALLAVVHFFLQSKLDEWEPTVMGGLLAWLMGYRLISWTFVPRPGLPVWLLGLLSIVTAIATAVGEAAYFWLSKDVSPILVLPANFSLETGVRPAGVVMVIGVIFSLAAALRNAAVRGAPG